MPKSPWTAGHVDDICAVNLVPPQKLVDFFKDCLARLKEIKGNEVGDYFEFGVFNGNSIGSMYLAREAMGLKSTRLFGFDAFQGLPPGAEKEDAGVDKAGFSTCSFEQMQQCLLRRNVNSNEITWVKGWYNETLNDETVRKLNLRKIGLVFIDCDTYSSSKAVLDFLEPLITEPVILCFDDWKLYDLDIKGEGEYRSFNEFLESNPQFEAEEIKSYNRKSRTFLVKPRK
ncbi:class I SAM-dependent methyltransferase [Candidatus Uhrbacteria bacterium]|nr:class I SAM-dependent methyltransferase [Candidatus Uhrbacteria bacterium]